MILNPVVCRACQYIPGEMPSRTGSCRSTGSTLSGMGRTTEQPGILCALCVLCGSNDKPGSAYRISKSTTEDADSRGSAFFILSVLPEISGVESGFRRHASGFRNNHRDRPACGFRRSPLRFHQVSTKGRFLLRRSGGVGVAASPRRIHSRVSTGSMTLSISR